MSAPRPNAPQYLDFEQPIAELEARIVELQAAGHDANVNINAEVHRLREHLRELTGRIFARLTPWQVARLARHPQRPYTLDYVTRILRDCHELRGDRTYADDAAIVAGLARLDGLPVAFVGHQKGRSTKENLERNFGMPKPEGFRKALRVMQLADRFGLPILSFIDTQGAYPGIGAEERGQSEAIARNIQSMLGLRPPIVAAVIGEGGSGGALALAVADSVLMLQYATYSVISPEGCASILWKDAKKAPEAANALGLTAERLRDLDLVDRVVPEPAGGAHRDYDRAAEHLKSALQEELGRLSAQPADERRARRLKRYLDIGHFEPQ
jgi:acetyl-CoA carboxylase carboxyl transferase subunit alpha